MAMGSARVPPLASAVYAQVSSNTVKVADPSTIDGTNGSSLCTPNLRARSRMASFSGFACSKYRATFSFDLLNFIVNFKLR